MNIHLRYERQWKHPDDFRSKKKKLLTSSFSPFIFLQYPLKNVHNSTPISPHKSTKIHTEIFVLFRLVAPSNHPYHSPSRQPRADHHRHQPGVGLFVVGLGGDFLVVLAWGTHLVALFKLIQRTE